jgi:hypothetical protein
MRVKLAFVVLLSALLLAACSNRSSGPEQLQQQAHIRVVSGLSDAPSIDVLLDGVALQSGASSKAVSDYLKVEAGTRNLTITVAGDASKVLLRQNLELAADTRYTVIAAGTTTGTEAIVVTDTTSATTADTLKMRVVQGAASAGPVDIYVTAFDAFDAANAAVTDGSPAIAGAKFSDVSDFMDLSSGTYRIRVTPAGDNATTVYDSGPVTLEGKRGIAFCCQSTS